MNENKLKSLSPEELRKKHKNLQRSMAWVFVIMIATIIALIILSKEKEFKEIMGLVPVLFIPYIITAYVFLIKVKKEIKSRE